MGDEEGGGSVSIIELLEAVGVENLEVQSLGNSMDGFTSKAKGTEARISFFTDKSKAQDLAFGKMAAMVVWMPADKLKEAGEKFTKEGAPA